MVFLAEPVVFLRLYLRNSKGYILLLLVPVYILVLLIANVSSIDDLSVDVLHAWRYETCRLLTWSTSNSCGKWQPQPSFPLPYDLPSILLQLILSVTPFIAYRQQLFICNLISQMAAKSALRFESKDAPTIHHEVRAVNRFYRVAGRHGAVLAAFSILVTVLATIGFSQLGLFQALSPVGLSENESVVWRHEAYLHWWANYQIHPTGWMAYVILSSVGAFYSIEMNVVGVPVLRFLWRTRRLIAYEANVDVVDGYWGYSGVRQVLSYTYTAFLIHAIGFALLVFVMPAPLAILFLIPILGQWVAVLVLTTYIPILLLSRGVRTWKARQLDRIQQIIDAHRVAPGYDEAQREAAIAPLREWADRVRNVRSFPFARPRDVLYVVLSVVGAVVTIVGAFKSTGSGP